MYAHTIWVFRSLYVFKCIFVCFYVSKNSWKHVRLIEWMKTSNYFVSMYIFQFKNILKFACLQIVQTYDWSFMSV